MTVPQFSFLKTQCYYWNTKQKHLLSSTKIPSDWLKTIGAPTTAGMGYVIVPWNPTVFFWASNKIQNHRRCIHFALDIIWFLVLWLVTFFFLISLVSFPDPSPRKICWTMALLQPTWVTMISDTPISRDIYFLGRDNPWGSHDHKHLEYFSHLI